MCEGSGLSHRVTLDAGCALPLEGASFQMMHPSAVSARLVINGLSHSLERDWRILAAGLRAHARAPQANAARAFVGVLADVFARFGYM